MTMLLSDRIRVAAYALAHGVCEFVVGFQLLHWASLNEVPAGLPVIYNGAAFLLPVLIGVAAAKRIAPATLGGTGCLLMALVLGAGQALWVDTAVLTTTLTVVIMAIVMGFGNACLHVAGGMVALASRVPHKATAVGVFVAPGAIGLAWGSQVGKSDVAWGWWVPALALAMAIMVAGSGRLSAGGRAISSRRSDRGIGPVPVSWSAGASLPAGASPQDESLRLARPSRPTRVHLIQALALLGLLIAWSLLRTVIGPATAAPWKAGPVLVMGAAIAAALGKGFGGVVSDRLGWLAAALISTLGCAAVLPWFPDSAVAGLAGICLLNLTVPLVLAALADLMPGYEGAAFGIGQLCQFPAALLAGLVWPPGAILAGCLGCAVIALAAFALTNRTDKKELSNHDAV
jgi:FSR family fosmidomycin resistance protein-like MFS transporter